MGLRISTNTQSLSGQRSLRTNRRTQESSLEKLSSGSRINKASDDAAGLAISEKFKSQIRGLRQASRNAGDGISLIQTAEGAMNEVNNNLIRLRELSVQTASDTLGEKERRFADMEFQELVTEIDRIAASTTFNEKNLLNGEGDKIDFQIGIFNSEENDRISYKPSESSVSAIDLEIDGLSVRSKGDSQNNLAAIDSAINSISGNRAKLGALQNRLQSRINTLDVTTENLSSANSRIRDTDVAVESANLAKSNILTASSTSVLAQANNSSAGALQLIG